MVGMCVLGLSHDRLQELQRLAEAAGHGQQGRSRSLLDNALSLRHVSSLQQLGLSTDAAIKTVAAADVASPSTIRAAYNQFTATGTLLVASTAHRGKGNPDHPLRSPSEPSFELERCIHRVLCEAARQVKHVAVKHVQSRLLEEENTHVAPTTLKRWMHELGYAWDDRTFIGALKPESRIIRLRQFIWAYAAALRLQRAGTHIIIYLDESYIHAAHQMKKGWHPASGATLHNETQGDADTGKRLIIIHAMSNEKMLAVEDAVGSNMLHEITPTAQFVFEAASFDDSDYHNCIDGDAFTLWVKNRLLPAFEACYPGKKMIIVMDNASGHKPRDFDWFTPRKMCKAACISFLQTQGVTTFSAERDTEIKGVTAKETIHFPQNTWHSTKRAIAPNAKELQAAVKAHLKKHPGINKTRIDKLLLPHGHSIVWTPPFTPEVQPIELVWAQVKGSVARQYTYRRNVDTTREQTDDALEDITGAKIQRVIQRCHRWIGAFMQTDDAGTLKSFLTLDALVTANPNTLPAQDTDAYTEEDNEEDDEEEAADAAAAS